MLCILNIQAILDKIPHDEEAHEPQEIPHEVITNNILFLSVGNDEISQSSGDAVQFKKETEQSITLQVQSISTEYSIKPTEIRKQDGQDVLASFEQSNGCWSTSVKNYGDAVYRVFFTCASSSTEERCASLQRSFYWDVKITTLPIAQSIVSILTVIDAASILRWAGTQTGTKETPIHLASVQNRDADTGISCQDSCIYMVTKAANAIQGQGTANLNIVASDGDSLHWYNTTVQNEQDYLVDFYRFQKLSGPDIFEENQPNPIGQYWQANIIKPAYGKTITYNWCFTITNRRTGAVAGYFCWSSSITLKNVEE